MTISAQESVIDVITELLTETLEVPAEEVRANAPMRVLLEDSLLVVELAIAVEDRLGVKIDEKEFQDSTLAEFAELVAARRAAG
ncbi:acyl carrier protein [Streptomyces sp. NBC_01351]|uniref:acyl carrier protein n=1 Tax=Streptomyces sp. NBC_01351 TaxID=2903833 RepID=UPI002E350A8C|nr:acyl carrier protein [Streptomyces sp. NBC_01351]